jgi:hypothetical protein
MVLTLFAHVKESNSKRKDRVFMKPVVSGFGLKEARRLGLTELAVQIVRIAALLTVVNGCEGRVAEKGKSPPPASLGERFDPKAAGTIRGKVTWDGEVPKVEPIKLLLPIADFDREQPNPNAAAVDPATHGVKDAIVFLKSVDPKTSRPWPHEPVEAAFEKGRLVVRQGKVPVRGGFVRRGEPATFVARETKKHHLDARGAAFFSLPLPEVDRAVAREMKDVGLVELSSGAGYYWLREYLWVGEHPYVARTDAAGGFSLDQVPTGEYEVIAWMPNWNVKRRERGPEFGEIERLVFEPSVERRARVTIGANQTADVTLTFRTGDFAPGK